MLFCWDGGGRVGIGVCKQKMNFAIRDFWQLFPIFIKLRLKLPKKQISVLCNQILLIMNEKHRTNAAFS